jgi:NADPH-dependent 2,4-dienoyl-CoA reductase/sulfur reductase-like enzyme
MLRREGYTGRITMLSADASLPCDRPSLSKGYLAGTAPPKSVPLRPRAFYEKHKITVKLNARAAAIDAAARRVELSSGKRIAYDALLLATGADPVRLDVPGHDLPHVRYLRTFADSRALLAKAKASEHAVVIGASFIGLEVAAALRAHDVEVHVVAPEEVPMERILGAEAGKVFRTLHEQHGVIFHLGAAAASFQERTVTLKSGERLRADLVVVGVGVRPAISLAEEAGLAIDRGVTVNEYLETSVPGIFAAGNIARWPDARTGERVRVEHWAVAERQGQTAAPYPGQAGVLRRRALLLDRPVRSLPLVCRSRGEVGQRRDRRAARRARLHDHLPERSQHTGGGRDPSGHREPARGGRA